MNYEDLIVPGIWVFLAIILVLGGTHLYKKRRAVLDDLGSDEMIAVGKYLAGFPGLHQPIDTVQCAVNDDDYVFLDSAYKTIASIPRNSINKISVEDKSTISERFTVTRMLAVGVFALAFKKKKKNAEFCLLIDWDDDGGERQNTVFQFANAFAQAAAGMVADQLNEAKLPKVDRLKPGERKCPQCAEVIKAEAKKCRYCQSDL